MFVAAQRQDWRTSPLSNNKLVENLKTYGIIASDPVEKAMLEVDRKHFVPSKEVYDFYIDTPQPIGQEESISAPHMHARCLELLKDYLKPGYNALDVGCGSGYFLACMAHMILDSPSYSEQIESQICGIEYHQELVEQSIQNLNKNPLTKQWVEENRIKIIAGDGWKGFPDKSNQYFHAIHVGAAAQHVPKNLINQLALGGRMIIPIGPPNSVQSLWVIDKDKNGNLSERAVLDVMYLPLVNPEKIL